MKLRHGLALVAATVSLFDCAGHHPHADKPVALSAPIFEPVPAPTVASVMTVSDTHAAGMPAGTLHDLTVNDLAALKHQSAEAVLARFGEPDFTRREAIAEIWQYRGATCVLDLFLYPENGELRVADALTRSRIDPAAPRDNCVPADPGGTPS